MKFQRAWKKKRRNNFKEIPLVKLQYILHLGRINYSKIIIFCWLRFEDNSCLEFNKLKGDVSMKFSLVHMQHNSNPQNVVWQILQFVTFCLWYFNLPISKCIVEWRLLLYSRFLKEHACCGNMLLIVRSLKPKCIC